MTRGLRLTIDLVPETSWCKNLRKMIPPRTWERIRREASAKSGNRCAICGAEGRLNCHEMWRYDDRHNVQRLVGFVALCNLCHHVKHIGLAVILAAEGRLSYERVVEHFLEVNNCDRGTFAKHKTSAFAKWRDRSQRAWTTDLGEYSTVVKSEPVGQASSRSQEVAGL